MLQRWRYRDLGDLPAHVFRAGLPTIAITHGLLPLDPELDAGAALSDVVATAQDLVDRLPLYEAWPHKGLLLAHFIIVLARGVPIVTHTTMRIAEGDPALIPAKSILRHNPLMETAVCFRMAETFYHANRVCYEAVKACCAEKMPRSKWTLSVIESDKKGKKLAPPPGGKPVIELSCEEDIRSWLYSRSEVLSTNGPKMTILEESGGVVANL